MFYIFKNTFEGVHHEFKVESNELFFLLKIGGIERVNENLESKWNISSPKFYDLRIQDSIITAKDVNGEFFVFSKDDGHLLRSVKDTNSYVTSVNQYYFIFDRTKKFTTLFDFNANKQEWQSEFRIGFPVFSNDKILVSCQYLNKQCFEVRSISNGALLWHFDVTEPGRYREWYPEGPEHPGVVTKFLGVWHGRLYVAVSNGLIIELDLENGRLLRSWQQLPDGITLPPSGWDKLPGLELAFLDAAAGEIACVTHQYYWHIDLESGALHFHDLREHFSAAQLQVSPPSGDPAFDAEHIYFASEFCRYDGQTGANVYQLAALHRRSARIVWQQQVELPQSCQWKQHPVLDGRRLYALSHDLACSSEGGTLHIFERTE